MGGRQDEGTYEVSECGVRPQYTLGCNTLSRLTHVHRNGGAEEVLDLVAVRIRGDPTRSSDCNTTEDEGWEME